MPKLLPYPDEYFDDLKSIKASNAGNTYYVSELVTFPYAKYNGTVINEKDNKKTEVSVTQEKDGKSYSINKYDSLVIDLDTLPANSKISVRQIEHQGNTDLAIDIDVQQETGNPFEPLGGALASHTIIIPGQFNQDRGNGAGLEQITIRTPIKVPDLGNGVVGYAVPLNEYSEENGKPVLGRKLSFDEFKANFDKTLKEANTTLQQTAVSKDEPEYVRLAKNAFAPEQQGFDKNALATLAREKNTELS